LGRVGRESVNSGMDGEKDLCLRGAALL